MLVHFQITLSDFRETKENFQTVYLSNELSVEELGTKFKKLLQYFKEKSNNRVNYCKIEDYKNELTKSYSFSINTYSVSPEQHFQKFIDLEWSEKFKEPKIFLFSDLIGWNFVNAFIDCNNLRRFTFEKDNEIKQYVISSKENKDLNRNYCFTINNERYYEKNGTTFAKKFDGNIFEISQVIKGKVLNIECNNEIFKLVTEIGELSYSIKYRDSLIISESLNLIHCPYENLKNELIIKVRQKNVGETIKIDFIKVRGNSYIGSVYGEAKTSDYKEFNEILNCYIEVTNRILKIVNKTEDFDKVKYIYSKIEDIVFDFPELDLSNLYLNFKQIKINNDELVKLKNEKKNKEKLMFEEIKKKNNFSHSFKIKDVELVLNSYVKLYENEYNYGKVKYIQLQVRFPNIYVESCLDWKYYKKYYILADINVNSCHDKNIWSESIFLKIANKLIRKLKNKNNFEIFLNGESGTNILGEYYQLDHFLNDNYDFQH